MQTILTQDEGECERINVAILKAANEALGKRLMQKRKRGLGTRFGVGVEVSGVITENRRACNIYLQSQHTEFLEIGKEMWRILDISPLLSDILDARDIPRHPLQTQVSVLQDAN